MKPSIFSPKRKKKGKKKNKKLWSFQMRNCYDKLGLYSVSWNKKGLKYWPFMAQSISVRNKSQEYISKTIFLNLKKKFISLCKTRSILDIQEVGSILLRFVPFKPSLCALSRAFHRLRRQLHAPPRYSRTTPP